MIDHREAGRMWDRNADAWTALARAGYDVYRDAFNTPAFLEMLPDVEGLRGLDIGCGEGANTRSVADLGARMTAVDVSPRFVRHARGAEDGSRGSPPRYAAADALRLPFPDGAFDFATAFMSLMEFAETGLALSEARRVLRPGGFLQFSITHPCTDTPHRVNLRNEEGRTYALEIGGYFDGMPREPFEWTFTSAPPEALEGLEPFRVARYHRPLSEWLNLVIDAGFRIERTGEPRPTAEAVARRPRVQDARAVPYFLHLRVRKPE